MNGTRVSHDFTLFLILSLLLVVAIDSSAQLGTDYVHNAPTSVLFIYGNVTHPVAIDSGLIRRLPQVQLKVTNSNTNDVEIYSGVPLKDLLARADVSAGKDLQGKAVSLSLAAVDKDGARVVLSLAETDSVFHNGSQVIVADALNKKLLNASDGPLMLIVIGDTGSAHLVPNLTRIQVNTTK